MKLSRRAFLRLGMLAALGLVGGKGFYNSRSLEYERIGINLERLPSGFDGFKIAQITDIHCGPLAPPKLLRTGVDLVMGDRPDLIALTGDFVHGATKFLWSRIGGFKKKHLEECLRELGRLSAPQGVFAVLGNHDYWSGPQVTDQIVQGLRNIGVRVLRNESMTIQRQEQSLILLGVEDYWEGPADLIEAAKNTPDNACKILLSHNPDVNDDVNNLPNPIDLILSGHTHGGQLILPFVGPPYPTPFNKRYLSGLVRDGARQTYVSRGLGVFFVPLRFNCPPEVTLLTLHRSHNS